MSDQNPLIKLAKKSVGLPTGEADCCGPVVPQVSQEIAHDDVVEQPADTSSSCDSQGSVGLAAGQASCCEAAALQVSQEAVKQGVEEKPTDTSSCCGS